MWIWLAAAISLAGHYDGVTEAGRVRLHLRDDGTARFAGAECRWRRDGDALVLDGCGETLRLRVGGTPDAPVLTGPPFGTVWLRPVEVPPETTPAPAPPPSPFVGAWRHEASGGTLVLVLRSDGVYEMRQRAKGAAEAQITTGRWAAGDASLTLTPDGGAPLTYRAAREGDRLRVGGGDLPMEVALSRMEPAPESSL